MRIFRFAFEIFSSSMSMRMILLGTPAGYDYEEIHGGPEVFRNVSSPPNRANGARGSGLSKPVS